MKSPEEIVNLMMSRDAFSQWMGIEVISVEKGNCHLRCSVHEYMLNGFRILHGGISYSLSDSCLAFASNSYGYKCVSIETSISHLRAVRPDEILDIYATEVKRGRSIGIYKVRITNQNGDDISHFKGTVHISEDRW